MEVNTTDQATANEQPADMRLKVIFGILDHLQADELLQAGEYIKLQVTRLGVASQEATYRDRRHYEDMDSNAHMNLLHQRQGAILELLSDLSTVDGRYIISEIGRMLINQ